MKLEKSSTRGYDGPMSPPSKEVEREFLEKVSEYLVSLPFDLKILQEAASDLDLQPKARELAAGAIMHTLLPQEGEGPLRFVDDVLFVRAAFQAVAQHGGEAFAAFRERFPEIYDKLDADVALFAELLGELWTWIAGKVDHYGKLVLRGKKAKQYVADEEGLSLLYEEGLEFETNYNVTEEQVRNRVRRTEPIVELLQKRRADDLKKIS